MLKTITYLCIFFAVVSLINTRFRSLCLLYAILIAALSQAMVGSIATLQETQQSARGTFPNPNHFAGYLEMSIGLGIGLMIALQDQQKKFGRELALGWLHALTGPKARLRLILLIMVIGLVMSASRMGNIALFSSIIIATACYAIMQRRLNRMTAVFLASILIVDVAVIGNYFGIDRVSQRIQTMTLETETRDEINQYSLQILNDYPWVGTGAGTYELIFTRYRGPDITERITNAENDYLEFLVELGIIGCIPLLLILLIGLWTQIRLLRHRSQFTRGVAFGCLTGTISLLIHSATDFNLQIPSNAALFLVLLALPQALAQHDI